MLDGSREELLGTRELPPAEQLHPYLAVHYGHPAVDLPVSGLQLQRLLVVRQSKLQVPKTIETICKRNKVEIAA